MKWKCIICKKTFIEDSDDIVLVYHAFLSRYTPVLGVAKVYCESCYKGVCSEKDTEQEVSVPSGDKTVEPV